MPVYPTAPASIPIAWVSLFLVLMGFGNLPIILVIAILAAVIDQVIMEFTSIFSLIVETGYSLYQ